jgi:hypothetical protein
MARDGGSGGIRKEGEEFRSDATMTSLLLPFEFSFLGLFAYDFN